MTPPLRADVVLRGGILVTVDDSARVITDGVVAIDGDRIAAVGTSTEVGPVEAKTVIDCSDTLVIPGLVDAHTHLFQAAAAGLGDGLPVIEWLQRAIWPYAARLDTSGAAAVSALGAARALRAGTTTVLDHHYAPTSAEATMAVADAIEHVGLRGVVARGMLGDPVDEFPVPPPLRRYSNADEIAITNECMNERGAESAVAIWPGPGNVHAAHPEILVAAAELATTHSCRWHTHTSESRHVVGRFSAVRGSPPVMWMSRLGVLSNSTHAHAIHLDDDELDLLGTSAGVAHCPVSNAYLGSGVAPVRRLTDAGARISLGTDGAAVGARGILECMKAMVHLQRITSMDPTIMTAHEALAAATRHGADLLGIPAGRIAEGFLADLVVVELPANTIWPIDDPANALVTLATERDVRDVLVGGRVAVQSRRCVHVDEADVLGTARGSVQRADLSPEFLNRTNPRS